MEIILKEFLNILLTMNLSKPLRQQNLNSSIKLQITPNVVQSYKRKQVTLIIKIISLT